jgi:Divergent InlB B-repeat domain
MRRLQFFLICLGIMLLGVVMARTPLFLNFANSVITANSADISFDFDLPDPAWNGDLFIDYGTTPTAFSSRIYLGAVVGGALQPKTYSFSGLIPGTTYYWGALYVDSVTGVSNSPIQSFTTLQNLTVTINGTGSGTVLSSPAGINCTATCSGNFPAGSVTLTATPNAGSSFSGWAGACTNATGDCIVTMEAAKTVYASFTTNPFALTVTTTGYGTVSSIPAGINCPSVCTADFAPGTIVELTVTPDAGAAFTGWGGPCTSSGTNPSCSVTIIADTTVNADTAPLGSLYIAVDGLPSGSSTELQVTGPGLVDAPTVLTGTRQFYLKTASGTYTVTAPNVVVAGITYTPNIVTQTANIYPGVGGSQQLTFTYSIQVFTLDIIKAGVGTGTVSSNPAGIDCGATCSSSFSQNTVVSLSAIATSGSRFAGWTGDCTNITGDCVVTMNAVKSVTATFEPVVFSLTLASGGAGIGYITFPALSTSCATQCSVGISNGTVITLTATAYPGYTFAGWSGPCSGVGDCTFIMNSTTTVNANFNANPPVLFSITKNGTGTGSISSDIPGIDCGATCTANFNQDTVVSFAVTPDTGSRFAGWAGACTGTGDCKVTMDAAKNVTATFNLIPKFALTVTKTGAGTISSSPVGIDCGATCTSSFDQNTVVTLTPTPGSGISFLGWTGACTGIGACTVTMNALKSVSASFEPTPLPVFALTTTIDTTGTGTGNVSSNPVGINCPTTCSKNFDQNTSVTLTATPVAGSSFAGWTGACTGLTTCSVTMDAAKTVTATFNLIPKFALTVTKSSTGTGTGSISSDPAGIDCGSTCTSSFLQGKIVTLTASAASGSSFAGWTGDCTGTGACAVTMDAAKSVTATFNTNAVPTFALTVTKTGAGTILSAPAGIDCGATCTSSFNQGTSITLTATPAAGSSFTGWTGACTGTATCVITMDAVKTVTATFTANPPANVSSSKPSNAPADRMVIKGSSDNAALAFALTLPNGSLSSITLNVSGSGNDATDLTNVKLYKDSNANGLVDAGEPMLASGKFLGNDGTLTLTPASVAVLAASGATQFVVAVDVNNTLAALRFAPVLGGLLLMGLGVRRRRWLGAVGLVLLLNSCQPPIPAPEIRTYQINLTAVTAKDSSNVAVNITGLPIAGATLSIEK